MPETDSICQIAFVISLFNNFGYFPIAGNSIKWYKVFRMHALMGPTLIWVWGCMHLKHLVFSPFMDTLATLWHNLHICQYLIDYITHTWVHHWYLVESNLVTIVICLSCVKVWGQLCDPRLFVLGGRGITALNSSHPISRASLIVRQP